MPRKDPRPRNQAHLANAKGSELRAIEWASQKQEEAFQYGPYPLCVSGGYGSSKTWALCLKALYLSDTYPNNRGVIARKIAKELERTTQSTFFKICPPAAYDPDYGGRRADSENYLRLARSGSEILWLHLDDPDIDGIVRGLEINWFIIDQAEEVSEDVFASLCSRLGRWDKCIVPETTMMMDTGAATLEEAQRLWPWKDPTGRPIPPIHAMIACNPDAYTHWIYRRFHPESPDHKAMNIPVLDNGGQFTGRYTSFEKLHYKMISMKSYENKFLPKQNLAELMTKDSSFIRRFVEAEWGIQEGQIHEVSPLSEIEGDLETVEYIRRNCTLHRAMDHGDASPTCCLWYGVDRDQNVFFYREYYVPNKLISEHREAITELSRDERILYDLADPSIFSKIMQKYGGKWSVADEYSDVVYLPKQSALFWIPADNNELGTRNRINEYLRVDPERIHPITKQRGSPRIFWVKKSDAWPNGCHHSLLQTKSQRRKRIGTDLGKPVFSDERDDTITDHGYDPVRYALASRPPVQSEQAKQYGYGTFGQVHKEMLRFKKSGGYERLRRMAKIG